METNIKPPTEVQLKRREKELNLLAKLPPEIKFTTIDSPIGFTVQIEVKKEHCKPEVLSNPVIHILMDYKYPFQPPRVHWVKNYPTVWLGDCRDILRSVISAEWLPTTTILDIAKSIPNFVSKAWNNADNPEYCRTLGTFHLGEIYDIGWFADTSCKVLNCKEESLADTGVEEERIAVLSDTFLLVFEPEVPKNPAGIYATLLFYSPLPYLLHAKRNLKLPTVINFKWTQTTQEGQDLRLKFEDGGIFLKDLVTRTRKLQGDVVCNKKNEILCVRQAIPTYEEMSGILNAIKEQEKNAAMTPAIYSKLKENYKLAIEYYVNKKERYWEIYLNKLKMLMAKFQGKEEAPIHHSVINVDEKDKAPTKGTEMKIMHV